MFGRDPRDQEGPDGERIRDRKEDRLDLRRDPGLAMVHDDRTDRELDDRDQATYDRENDRGSVDPRAVLSRDLDLPRGPERELVRGRDRDYRLNGSDARTLSSVGAFRVVHERDLNDSRIAPFDVH